MSHIMSKKPSAMQWWLLVLVLMLTGGVLVCGAALWQSRSKDQAQQITARAGAVCTAADGRVGIEFEQQWYAPRNDISTVLLVGVDEMGPLEDSGSYNNNSQADFLLLAVTDHRDKTVTALHLNRDSMTQIPVLGVTGQPAGTITGSWRWPTPMAADWTTAFEIPSRQVSTLLGGITIHTILA